jgi:WD40 repeat protein
VEFFSDGSKLVSGSSDGSIRIWNTLQKTLQMELALPGTSIDSMALSEDNELIAAGYSNSDIRIWSTTTGITISQLTSLDNPPRHLALSLDNSYLAVVTYEESETTGSGRNWVIRIWDIQGEAVHHTLFEPDPRTENFLAIAFGKERNIVMTATDLWITSVWNLETEECHRKIERLRPWTILDEPEIPLFELAGQGYSKLSQYFSNT